MKPNATALTIDAEPLPETGGDPVRAVGTGATRQATVDDVATVVPRLLPGRLELVTVSELGALTPAGAG